MLVIAMRHSSNPWRRKGTDTPANGAIRPIWRQRLLHAVESFLDLPSAAVFDWLVGSLLGWLLQGLRASCPVPGFWLVLQAACLMIS